MNKVFRTAILLSIGSLISMVVFGVDTLVGGAMIAGYFTMAIFSTL